MPRHDTKRDNRSRADEEISILEEKLETYEEEVRQSKTPFKWKNIGRLLLFPVPNKITEIECIAKRPFSAELNPFFAKPKIGENGEEIEDSSASEKENDEEEDEEEEDVDEENSQKGGTEWKMVECYVFCLKQLAWSRFWIFLLQFVASAWAGNRFRTDAFNLADRMTQPGKSAVGDFVVRYLFAGLRRWDAQHFLFISDNHYIFEQSLAFFPGFPEIVNIIRMSITYHLQTNYNITVAPWVVTGILTVALNVFFFHVAGFCLFMVSLMTTRSVKKSLLAVSIFAYNPASIFFSAAYSESMFFALTLTGFSLMLFAIRSMLVMSRISGAFIGSTVFGLSFVARSNGSLNLLFVAWYFCGSLLWEPEIRVGEPHKLTESIAGSKNDRYRREASARLREFERRKRKLRKVFRWTDPAFSRCFLVIVVVGLAVLSVLTFFTPYLFMTNSLASEFCRADPRQKELMETLKRVIRLPAKIATVSDAMEKTSWCRKEKWLGIFPQFYGAIQAKYWDVGLFSYWQIKKIPCFLMALPAAILTILAIRWVWRDVFENKRWHNIWVLTGRSDHLLPMAFHAAILLFIAIFYINAEVFTRLIFSSSPLLYIFIADFLDENTQGNTMGNRMWHYEATLGVTPFFVFRRVWQNGWTGKLLYTYIFSYFVVGTMMHAAWLPFT